MTSTTNNEINNNNTFASTDAFDNEEINMAKWHWQFNTTNEQQMFDNYENCKFQFASSSTLWTTAELSLFAEQIQSYEATHSSVYIDGVNLWKRYGLSQENYDAQLNYENALNKMETYFERGEDEEEDLEYENTLNAIITTFEKQMEEQLTVEAKADDENDWWMNSNAIYRMTDQIDTSQQDCCETSEEDEEESSDDEASISSEDLMEERIDFAAENEKDSRSSF